MNKLADCMEKTTHSFLLKKDEVLKDVTKDFMDMINNEKVRIRHKPPWMREEFSEIMDEVSALIICSDVISWFEHGGSDTKIPPEMGWSCIDDVLNEFSDRKQKLFRELADFMALVILFVAELENVENPYAMKRLLRYAKSQIIEKWHRGSDRNPRHGEKS